MFGLSLLGFVHQSRGDIMTYQKCIKCLKIMAATIEYFYKSKTHKLGVHKSCKSCDYIRHKINLNVRKENNNYAFSIPGNFERRWLVCSRRVLRNLNKQNWSSNENITNNLSLKWNYIIINKVLRVLRNTLITNIKSS